MYHRGLGCYNEYINHDPLGHLNFILLNVKEKNSRKWANGQSIYDSVNRIDPSGSSVPALGLYTCIWP